MATPQAKQELNADELKIVTDALEVYKATQTRAANAAKNQAVKNAFAKSAADIGIIQIRLSTWVI